MKALLFGGTNDGRELAGRLAALPIALTVSVATEYGRDLLGPLTGGASVLVGRLDGQAMERLFRDERYDVVIDATHPYAARATETIRTAADAAGVRLLRLSRDPGDHDGCIIATSPADAAQWLAETEGNVLLATGSKDLAAFTSVPGFASRLYPRILPTPESLDECMRLGFSRSNIIAMQGPFSRELNAALMRQFAIAVLVTKDGGAPGGFQEKVDAAADVGARVVLIERPGNDGGMSGDEIVAEVRTMLEANACG